MCIIQCIDEREFVASKKKAIAKEDNPSAHWEVSEHIIHNGRHVEKGTEVTITGERGRFKFMRHVYNPAIDVEWIDCVGGKKGTWEWRSFRKERIKRVHYKKKIRLSDKEIKDQAKLEE